MIELLAKLPDTVLAALFAWCIWLLFNYAVLADRAMAFDIETELMPACVENAAARQTKVPVQLVPLGAMLGIPELDAFQGRLVDSMVPPALTQLQLEAICACAMTTGRSDMKFDYMFHTATFRILSTDAIAEKRASMLTTLTNGSCASL